MLGRRTAIFSAVPALRVAFLASLLLAAGVIPAKGSHDTTLLPLRSDSPVCVNGGSVFQTLSTVIGGSLSASGAFTGTTSLDFLSPPLGSAVTLSAGTKGGVEVWVRNPEPSSITIICRAQFFDFDQASATETEIVGTGRSGKKHIDAGADLKCETPANAIGGGGYALGSGHVLKLRVTIEVVSGSSFQVLYNGPSGAVGGSIAQLPENGTMEWPFGSSATCTPVPTSTLEPTPTPTAAPSTPTAPPTPTEIPTAIPGDCTPGPLGVCAQAATPTATQAPASRRLVVKLALVKKVSIVRGRPANFTGAITVINPGSEIQNLVVNLERPATVKLVSTTPTGTEVLSDSGSTGTTWNFPVVRARKNTSIKLKIQVGADVPDGTLSFSVAASTADGRSAAATASIMVQHR